MSWTRMESALYRKNHCKNFKQEHRLQLEKYMLRNIRCTPKYYINKIQSRPGPLICRHPPLQQARHRNTWKTYPMDCYRNPFLIIQDKYTLIYQYGVSINIKYAWQKLFQKLRSWWIFPYSYQSFEYLRLYEGTSKKIMLRKSQCWWYIKIARLGLDGEICGPTYQRLPIHQNQELLR